MTNEGSPSRAQDDPVRIAIQAERRSRRQELRQRREKDARETLLQSLNSADNIRHLLEFASLLCRVARELKAAGVSGDIPDNTASQRVGRELLALARAGDVREVARVAHRRMFEFYEPLEEEYRLAASASMIARWRRGGMRQGYKLVRKYLEEPDIPHNRANWQHVAGLHYLRVEFWWDLGALAGFEEEDGALLDPHEPLSADDPGLPFPALCAMTADDLRDFLTKRSREFQARVPLRVRRNVDRIRLGCAMSSRINETPIDSASASNETCLTLIAELDRMALVAAWRPEPSMPDATTPPERVIGERVAAGPPVTLERDALVEGWKDIRGTLSRLGLKVRASDDALRDRAKKGQLPVIIDPKGGRPTALESSLRRWAEEVLRKQKAIEAQCLDGLTPVERAAATGGASFAGKDDVRATLSEKEGKSRRYEGDLSQNADNLNLITALGQSRRSQAPESQGTLE